MYTLSAVICDMIKAVEVRPIIILYSFTFKMSIERKSIIGIILPGLIIKYGILIPIAWRMICS